MRREPYGLYDLEMTNYVHSPHSLLQETQRRGLLGLTLKSNIHTNLISLPEYTFDRIVFKMMIIYNKPLTIIICY